MKRLIALSVLMACATYAQQPVTGSGTAGTAASGVITVQGISSMTKLLVTPDSVALPANQSVNVAQINGVTPLMGAGNGGTGSLRVNIASDQVAVPVTFGPVATSGGALTLKHNSSAAAANTKATAGNLYGYALGNSGTVDCWLQLFNSAGTPTAGTSVIDSIMVQAGVTVVSPPGGVALENLATGIAYAGATADSGATTTGCTTTFSVSLYYN